VLPKRTAITGADVADCVRAYAELWGEINTPCAKMLREAGADGVRALGELIRSEASSDTETVACFAAQLLAGYDHPDVVPVLLRTLEQPGTPYPDEVRESVFNGATGNPVLLDPSFIAAARHLRGTWPTAWLVDQFLEWAERQNVR
jgi:hypothetical protein